MEDGVFKCGGEDFFPLMLNYVVSFQSNEAEGFIIAPSVDYDSIRYVDAVGKDAVKAQLTAHFTLIKELGFNTLRVCLDRLGRSEEQRFYFSADRNFFLDNAADRKAILNGLSDFVAIADSCGLHLMLLLKPPMEAADLEEFTKELLAEFKDCSAIFAYDFMNEPLYFDPVELRDKVESYRIVCGWQQMMRQYAPHHLFTIGFAEPIEVFEWDPAILPVDFVEFHTYHPLRIPSEIYWYSRYVGKPWMIGETSLPANNDSISYAEYRDLFASAYRLTRDAGGCGFGWWDFQEPYIEGEFTGSYEAAFTGLLNHEGTTQTSDKQHVILGTPKISQKQIADIVNHYQKREMGRPVNFYNMLGYNNICIRGRILEETGKPIEGAVVRGWNDDWSVGMNTYSDENGCFTLYCNAPCSHFEISAPRMNRAKFDRPLPYYSNATDQESDVNNLKNSELEYQRIPYQPFLKKNPTHIFDFNPDLFSQSEYYADLGDIFLQQLKY